MRNQKPKSCFHMMTKLLFFIFLNQNFEKMQKNRQNLKTQSSVLTESTCSSDYGQGGGQVGQIASKSRQIPIFCISRSNQSHFTQAWPRWLSPTINTMDLLCLTIIGWSLERMGEEKDALLLIAVKRVSYIHISQ